MKALTLERRLSTITPILFVVLMLALVGPSRAEELVETQDYRIVLGDDGLPESWELVGPLAKVVGEDSIMLWERRAEPSMLAVGWGSEDSSETERATVVLEERRETEDALTLLYRSSSANGLEVERTYSFPRRGLESTLKIRFTNSGSIPLSAGGEEVGPSLVLGPGMGRHGLEPGGLASQLYSYVRPAFLTDERLVVETLDREDPKISADQVRWVALHSRYFAVALIPPGDGSNLSAEGSVPLGWVDEQIVTDDRLHLFPTVRLIFPASTLQPGASRELETKVFFGPKTRNILASVGVAGDAPARLDELLFPALWDWLRWLCFVLMDVLRWLQSWIGSWGISILALALVVRLVTFPVAQIGLKEQSEIKAQQEALKPHIEELNKKYEDDPDARTEALFALYKEHGVNPLAPMKGCLWVGLQIPIFVALFNLLGQAYELRGAGFLWIADLSAPDRLFALGFEIPYFGSHFNLLPVIMAGSQVLVTHFSSPADSDGDSHSRAMLLMAVAFFLLFYTFPAGLVLYWAASNLFQLAQQLASELWWRWRKKEMR